MTAGELVAYYNLSDSMAQPSQKVKEQSAELIQNNADEVQKIVSAAAKVTNSCSSPGDLRSGAFERRLVRN